MPSAPVGNLVHDCFIYVKTFNHFKTNIKLNIICGIYHKFLLKLQVSGDQLLENGASGNSSIGTFLGWAMTFLYLSGRMPQIWLNVSFIIYLLSSSLACTTQKNVVT